jgi:hypothetical protein
VEDVRVVDHNHSVLTARHVSQRYLVTSCENKLCACLEV